MLNYETLLSSYDDKLTLMQWLKKVEEALKDASAVSFNVNKRGDATLTFSVVFEDGSELETGPITLQQGESVSSASIVNGHLILMLTNGTALDAGDLGGVSGFSIDASQHLIVTYQNGTTQDLGAVFDGATIKLNAVTSDNDEIQALKPVVENMTSYVFSRAGSSASVDIEYIYASIVKNGNKLTLAIALNITILQALSSPLFYSIGNFYIPSDVLSKLYPTRIGNADLLEARQINVYGASYQTPEAWAGYISKSASGIVPVVVIPTSSQTNQKYFVRYEATFLLAENMAA